MTVGCVWRVGVFQDIVMVCIPLQPHLQIEKHAAWHVLSGTSLREKGVEGIITAANGLVRGHLAIGLDAVLEAVELPAGITNLDTGLADMDAAEADGCLKRV